MKRILFTIGLALLLAVPCSARCKGRHHHHHRDRGDEAGSNCGQGGGSTCAGNSCAPSGAIGSVRVVPTGQAVPAPAPAPAPIGK